MHTEYTSSNLIYNNRSFTRAFSMLYVGVLWQEASFNLKIKKHDTPPFIVFASHLLLVSCRESIRTEKAKDNSSGISLVLI